MSAGSYFTKSKENVFDDYVSPLVDWLSGFSGSSTQWESRVSSLELAAIFSKALNTYTHQYYALTNLEWLIDPHKDGVGIHLFFPATLDNSDYIKLNMDIRLGAKVGDCFVDFDLEGKRKPACKKIKKLKKKNNFVEVFKTLFDFINRLLDDTDSYLYKKDPDQWFVDNEKTSVVELAHRIGVSVPTAHAKRASALGGKTNAKNWHDYVDVVLEMANKGVPTTQIAIDLGLKYDQVKYIMAKHKDQLVDRSEIKRSINDNTIEIVKLSAEGITQSEIARQLGVSRQRVNYVVKHLKERVRDELKTRD